MEMGKVGSVRSEINVTPLVDVCLVLLIIFIVIQPMTQMGYNATIPPKAPANVVNTPPPDQLVVSVADEHERRDRLDSAAEQPEHVQRRLVRPVHVLEHQDG